MEFIKKICVCDMDVISTEELCTYDYLVQYITCEYCNLVYSKRWEPDIGKDKYQDQTFLTKEYTVAIEK